MDRIEVNKQVSVKIPSEMLNGLDKTGKLDSLPNMTDSIEMAIDSIVRSIDYAIHFDTLKSFCNYNVSKEEDGSCIIEISFKCNVPKLKEVYFNYKGDIVNANIMAYDFMLLNGEPEHILYGENLIGLFYSDKSFLVGRDENSLVFDVIEEKGE